MTYTLYFSDESSTEISNLKRDPSQKPRFKAVKKALKLLSENPGYPSLQSKVIKSFKGPNNEKIWQSYAQQHTPGAYRIFWFYGPKRKEITIVSIIPHP